MKVVGRRELIKQVAAQTGVCRGWCACGWMAGQTVAVVLKVANAMAGVTVLEVMGSTIRLAQYFSSLDSGDSGCQCPGVLIVKAPSRDEL